ncbi:MAG: DUF4390 domain-containing protein [Longimicrobiales bacterium]
MLPLMLIARLLLPVPVRAPPPQVAPLGVAVGTDGTATVRVGEILDDDDLADAVRSGLPLRMRFRLELWRDEWFDDLIDTERWAVVLYYDPLEEVYGVRLPGQERITTYPSYAEASAAAQAAYSPPLRTNRGGRYYFAASLQIETLSLSDLEELELWLRGELVPAVGGGESLPGAFEEGLRRALVRILRLPARIYEARSAYFRVP